MRVLIISSLFLICWSNSSAQVSFGVKFGGNVNGLLDRTSGSLVYSANKEELSYGSGFHVGFYSRFSKGKLSFIPEIQYSKRNISNSSYNLIELPLLLNYRISKFIEIDGGVNQDNAPKLIQAGADVLVAGNFVFGSSNPLQTIASLAQLHTVK